ncbi:MAG: metalloregulator ArsR/SmtB family transcription factor [Planctomycetes bacterium]|nr:metalloregulator ArsR/SmtB family transcription factor [Planctomycetota bacterium]
MIAPPHDPALALKLLCDPTRLRILGLVERAELSVGELARALEMAQSRVSNHLRVLREADVLAERHAGRTTWLSLAPLDAAPGGAALLARLWAALRADLPALPEHRADVERLERVLAERAARSGEFFDRVAGEWDKIGVDFATGQARQRAAAALLARESVVADLGCGTGWYARALAPLCSRVVLVDRSQAMLDEALRKLEPLPPGVRVEARRGELDALPIVDGELDGAVAGLVLHHLAELDSAVREIHRALKPGGRVAIVELAPHGEEWMREALGDRALGLDPRDVLRALERAGFQHVTLESLEDRYRPHVPGDDPEARAALPLYLVRACKPARA